MKVFSNFIWRFAERCGAQLVTFIVSIVLARILTPSDYGTIALVTVFTTILQVFIDSGLSTALIQKKNADDLDFSSVFYFNFVICIILYLIMFVSAPFIADFYKYGFVGLMLDWIDKGMQEDYHKIVMMMGTALDGNIARSIENFKQK